MKRRRFREINTPGAMPSLESVTRRRLSKRIFRVLHGGGIAAAPTLFFTNDSNASIPSGNFDNIDTKFGGVTTLLPTTAADLADCNVYLLGVYGSTKEFPPAGGYDVWNLSSTNESVLAAWVAAGGKLIVAVDYKQIKPGGGPPVGSIISTAYATSLNGLLSAAGSALSVTPTDFTGTGSATWPTNTFSSTSLTSGITGSVSYDDDAGSVIANGTLCFNGSTQTQIRFEVVGSGLIVLFSSRNTMWGDPTKTSPPGPPDWTAMGEFLQNIIDY